MSTPTPTPSQRKPSPAQPSPASLRRETRNLGRCTVPKCAFLTYRIRRPALPGKQEPRYSSFVLAWSIHSQVLSRLRSSSSPFPFTITNLHTFAVCLVASPPIAPFSPPSPCLVLSCRIDWQRRTSLGLTAIHSFHHLISSSSPCNPDHTIRIPATNSPTTTPTYGCISLTKYRSPDSFFFRCPVSPYIESLYPKLTRTTLRTRPSFDSRLPTWDRTCVVNRAGPRPSPLIHLQFSRGSPETTVVPGAGNPGISRVATFFQLALLLLRSHDFLATQPSYLDPDFAS